ncbi:hypothetical protein E7T09_09490 [Deinococcus sp. KSM4-11]|uniref:Ig-like domain-containing protein n=1 Tax=Deinococcus sp. KSM4-11 TaxID=2568654 RepID=UPI0010A4749E|nr:Ig-like domain-containing protein [Deinococcus sp. KSM4-11]THF87355.1 hypothetical protein E7T09_09490 [Deinococcus sp. KSM4-11]
MRRLSSLPARQITASAFLLTALMTACNPPGGSSGTVTGVSVSPPNATVRPADTVAFSATVTGTGSFSQAVTWKSSDTTIVTVDGNGVAKGIKAGTATITATSTTDTGQSGTATVKVDPTAFPSEGVKINFQPSTSTAPAGYVVDSGGAYSDATGYGWVTQGTHTGLNISANTRDRAIAGVDARLNTLIHMQYVAGSSSQGGVATPAAWEYKVPNGTYTVTVAVGDASNSVDSKHVINVESQPTITAFTPTATQHFTSITRRVTVSDGRITVDAIGGTNTKLDYVIIAPGNRPSVATPTPQEGQTMFNPAGSFSAELNVIASTGAKGSGLDSTTLTSSTVSLKEDVTGTAVAISPNTSGGGDVIVVKPTATLKENTKYRLRISSGVKDVNGLLLLPYETTFTTGTASNNTGGLAFTQVNLPTVPTTYAYTSVEMGPDGKLYASTLTGEILRFAINADGTLGTPEILKGLINAQGPRTVIGLKFDPSSTADNLKLWISNNAFYNVLDKSNPPANFTGKITLLSGPNLDTVQDYVIGLPRSVKDHMTNSVNFNPKEAGVLYFMQGSNSAMGARDATWGNRDESLLSGAMLRLDLSKLSTLPLNVADSSGYNSYAANAPLTLYATGIRNAYDLVFHKNGNIYTPTNGSAAGGNTPGSTAGAQCANGTTYNGPVVPPLTNATVQNDYLFRVVKGGYYGHPNPLRCEFVMNGGNPTNVTDPAEVVASGQNAGYPVGTMPDANWRGFAYNFGLHASADGAIEEYTTAGGQNVNDKLLVVRYSVGKDVIVLTPDSSGNIPDTGVQTGVAGLTFAGNGTSLSPLDITENRANGNLYVALLDESNGNGLIKLAKPK